MSKSSELIERLYDSFNTRDIDAIFPDLAEDVIWANGMDGGYVHGLEALREYWTRQWALVSPRVHPVHFLSTADGAVIVTVEQTVRDLDGGLLQDQDHALTDKLVQHRFSFRHGKVIRFDIEEHR